MNSGDLKTYKYVKISKSNFFTITILFPHNVCSETKNAFKIEKVVLQTDVKKLCGPEKGLFTFRTYTM